MYNVSIKHDGSYYHFMTYLLFYMENHLPINGISFFKCHILSKAKSCMSISSTQTFILECVAFFVSLWTWVNKSIITSLNESENRLLTMTSDEVFKNITL